MSSRPIVLHFDVNETIILLDSAQNFTTEITVNRILAKNAIGIVTRHSEWDRCPHALAPSAAWSADAALAPFLSDEKLRIALEAYSWERVESPTADAVSFKTFASDLFPDDDARCNQLINSFTELPHGASFRSTFEKLMAVLGDEECLLPSFLNFVQVRLFCHSCFLVPRLHSTKMSHNSFFFLLFNFLLAPMPLSVAVCAAASISHHISYVWQRFAAGCAFVQ